MELYYKHDSETESFYSFFASHQPEPGEVPDLEWLTLTERGLAPSEGDLDHLMWGQQKYIELFQSEDEFERNMVQCFHVMLLQHTVCMCWLSMV